MDMREMCIFGMRTTVAVVHTAVPISKPICVNNPRFATAYRVRIVLPYWLRSTTLPHVAHTNDNCVKQTQSGRELDDKNDEMRSESGKLASPGSCGVCKLCSIATMWARSAVAQSP